MKSFMKKRVTNELQTGHLFCTVHDVQDKCTMLTGFAGIVVKWPFNAENADTSTMTVWMPFYVLSVAIVLLEGLLTS